MNTGVRSVTIVVLPGESKSKSLGRSFSALTMKDCKGVVYVAPDWSSAVTCQ